MMRPHRADFKRRPNARWQKCAFLGLILAGTIAATASAAAVGADAGENCIRVEISPSPPWISAAVSYVGGRVTTGAGIVVVDPVSNTLVLYGPSGQGEPLGDMGLEGFLPSSIRQAPSGTYVLKLAGSKLVALTENLELLHGLGPLRNAAAGTGITSLYDWTVTNDAIVAFGTLVAPEKPEGYRLGFLRAELASLDRPVMLLEADEGQFYLYYQPFFAAIEDRAYFVRFSGGEAMLYEVAENGKLKVLENAIPDTFRKAPEIKTPNDGPASAPLIYGEIERSTVLAGLVSIDDRLFLLGRQPAEGKDTLWTMYEVDVEHGTHSQLPLVLPTTAPHLSVAVAGDRVFAFEKGKVVGLGVHTIPAAVVFDLDWLSSPASSPLRADRMSSRPVRCSDR